MSIDFSSILTNAGKSGLQTAAMTAVVGLGAAVVSSFVESRLKPEEPEVEETQETTDPETETSEQE